MEVKRQYLAVKYAKARYKSPSNRTNDPGMLNQTNDKYTQLILSNR